MTMKSFSRIRMAILCMALLPSTGMAQNGTEPTDKPKSEKKHLLNKAASLVETNMQSKVDTNYIQKPKQAWQISVKSRTAQTDLQMNSTVDGEAVYGPIMQGTGIEVEGPLHTHPRVMTPVSTSIGLKVGYRGLSASYMFPIGGDKGRSLSLRSIGSWYSVHLRWHKFEEKSPEMSSTATINGIDLTTGEPTTEPQELVVDGTWNLDAPIKIQTLVFDGFYIFNHRHFSYGAAYNQKTFQKRSAGSFIAGIMAYYADLRFDNNKNAELITYMGGMGRIRQWQGSVGAGYAYNYVPAKGWLIGATAMPMVTIGNRMTLTKYSTDFIEKATEEFRNIGFDDYINDTTDEYTDYTIKKEGSVSHNNRVALNFTTRVSITYNWSRYFVNVNGQFNNFQYSHKSSYNSMHGHLNDWYINAAIGVRL